MAEKCNWVSNSISGALDKFEALAFKSGQKAAGMTKAEAMKIHQEDEQELEAAYNAITGKVDALIACEIRESGGQLAPDEPEEEETEQTIVLVTDDCSACRELEPRLEGKPVTVVHAASDEGVALLEDTMDQGIEFDAVPAVFKKSDSKYRLVPMDEWGEALGLKP